MEAPRPPGVWRSDDLNADSVRDFLHTLLGGSITDLERLGHGVWSKAFAFRHDDASLVARFSALAEDFRKDERVAAFASDDLPIPRILNIGQAFGGFYAISERMPGRFLDELDAAGLRRVLPRLLQVLDAMRAIDLSETTGFGLWGADGRGRYASWREALLDIAVDRPANRTYGWRRQLAAWPTAEEAFAIGFAQLERSLEVCPNERHLVHSDLLNFNLLVDHDRVTGAIDWGSALYGDFVWDIAWLTFWQPWYPAWRDVDIARFAREHYSAIGLHVPDFEARLRCYELAIGLDGMAYQAFTRRWRDLEDTARRVVALAQSQR